MIRRSKGNFPKKTSIKILECFKEISIDLKCHKFFRDIRKSKMEGSIIIGENGYQTVFWEKEPGRAKNLRYQGFEHRIFC